MLKIKYRAMEKKTVITSRRLDSFKDQNMHA